jgi:hypothetical protein
MPVPKKLRQKISEMMFRSIINDFLADFASPVLYTGYYIRPEVVERKKLRTFILRVSSIPIKCTPIMNIKTFCS